jgi:threonine dehydratase
MAMTANVDAPLVTIADILHADARIRPLALRTPLVYSPALSDAAGVAVYFKCENLQRTGAFKIRGALNKVRAFVEAGEVRGVITASSGNHGQAVAYAAREYGLRCTVVVPETVVPVKEAAIRAFGADVVRCGTTSNERIAHALTLAERHGWVYVPPYDDPHIVAGQGTVGLEIAQQLPEVGTVLVPLGGGGLTSGVAVAVKALCPRAQVYGVEPDTADDTRQSLAAGRIIDIGETHTIADGLRTSHPGSYTFLHLTRYLDGVRTVSDGDILEAVRDLALQAKLVVEPSGAVAAASVRAEPGGLQGPVVCVLSGGNIDPAFLLSLLAKGTGLR